MKRYCGRQEIWPKPDDYLLKITRYGIKSGISSKIFGIKMAKKAVGVLRRMGSADLKAEMATNWRRIQLEL